MYERARPTYPRQLFVDLADCVGPASGAGRVLEIGAGTGQATRGLLDRGWRVVALEPGPELARVARRVLAGLGDVEVVESPFEQWPADEEGSFDLVFAATSWHWLDPAVACRRAAELLHPGGTLAVVSTEHVLPELDGDPFFRQVEQAYEAVGMSDGPGAPLEPHSVADPEVVAIADSGLFEAPVVHRYVRERIYSAQEYLDLLATYSGHTAAAPDHRQRLFADIRRLIEARPNASVRKHYLSILQTARLKG
ncbi:MAG: methyltransferase domain-containing protein [Geodermatophilaceae bacterium]|nr:methyltransferase domain-containing protein [Geodermatophilaceae bacterium]